MICHVGGLSGFVRQDIEGPQVLHVGSNHWVCVFLNVQGIYCLDSSASRGVHPEVKDLCGQLWPEKTVIPLKVQQQIGSEDCGLFACAFAEVMCNAHDLDLTDRNSIPRFQQNSMRQHIIWCFENDRAEPFWDSTVST